MAKENMDYDTKVGLEIAEARRQLSNSRSYSDPAKKRESVVYASDAYIKSGKLRLQHALNESGPHEILDLLNRSIKDYTTARNVLSGYESAMRGRAAAKAPDFVKLWRTRDEINEIIGKINRKKEDIRRKAHLPLEENLAILSFVAFIGALLTLSLHLTGNVIGTSVISANSIVSGTLFVLGIIFLSLYLIRKKK
ncbi:MAG: hypothetical protein M1165_00350 [Candidatus Pacearchaeota archaeon]|nr:hypothetical protein [Candidatus Pacearchaeota archaeon]